MIWSHCPRLLHFLRLANGRPHTTQILVSASLGISCAVPAKDWLTPACAHDADRHGGMRADGGLDVLGCGCPGEVGGTHGGHGMVRNGWPVPNLRCAAIPARPQPTLLTDASITVWTLPAATRVAQRFAGQVVQAFRCKYLTLT